MKHELTPGVKDEIETDDDANAPPPPPPADCVALPFEAPPPAPPPMARTVMFWLTSQSIGTVHVVPVVMRTVFVGISRLLLPEW
jgi:hypothetical protein